MTSIAHAIGISTLPAPQDGALRALAPMVSLTCLDMSGCTEVTNAGARTPVLSFHLPLSLTSCIVFVGVRQRLLL